MAHMLGQDSVLFALVGRLRVKSTRFAFAACQARLRIHVRIYM